MQQREEEGEEGGMGAGKEGEEGEEWKQERRREKRERSKSRRGGQKQAQRQCGSDEQRVDKLRPADWRRPGLQSEFALEATTSSQPEAPTPADRIKN